MKMYRWGDGSKNINEMLLAEMEGEYKKEKEMPSVSGEK